MILYVEDDLIVADLWALAIESAGYSVTRVRTPDKALDVVRNEISALDAILVDVMLPLGESISRQESHAGLRTGFVLINRIRQIYSEHNLTCVPIIAITIRNTYTPELINMGVKVVSKRRESPRKVLEILRSLRIQPDVK